MTQFQYFFQTGLLTFAHLAQKIEAYQNYWNSINFNTSALSVQASADPASDPILHKVTV